LDHTLFRRFCSIAYDQAGIALKDGKESLVAARVAKRMRALRIDSPDAYIRHLEQDGTGEELVHFLDAISTNYTSFYREPEHIPVLHAELQRLLSRGQRKIRIWCAAAATGEEPYTLGFTALETCDRPDVDLKILATDISTLALAQAAQGVYDRVRVEAVPRPILLKYFDCCDKRDPDGEAKYQVKPHVKSFLLFRRLNLAAPPFPLRGPLDIVFCRNVMIYFDTRVRQTLIEEIERLVRPGGLVFIGHSETLTNVDTELKLVCPAVYRSPASRVAGREGEWAQ
jgi:chemotaxis protein methyltransferase CheR